MSTLRGKSKTQQPAEVYEVGCKVRIAGNHPAAGKYGVVERMCKLLGQPAVEIKFNEQGDGAIVFAHRGHRLIRV